MKYEQLKHNMVKNGVNKYSTNRDLYRTISWYKINNLYKYAGKCDEGYHFKSTTEASMVYTEKGINNGSLKSVYMAGTTKKHSLWE